jgi:hypothetical protein
MNRSFPERADVLSADIHHEPQINRLHNSSMASWSGNCLSTNSSHITQDSVVPLIKSESRSRSTSRGTKASLDSGLRAGLLSPESDYRKPDRCGRGSRFLLLLSFFIVSDCQVSPSLRLAPLKCSFAVVEGS